MKDVSDWNFYGYGVDSTLEKNELLSPERFPDEPIGHRRYIIKFPRNFELGISWEDITEYIASFVGRVMKMKMMEVEIVLRNGRRGALFKNFVPYKGQFLEGGTILSEYPDYDVINSSESKGEELINLGFNMIEKLDFWNEISQEFITMIYFDILIGNQDRHPYNWMMVYYENGDRKFSPIYDNGASLGFRFDDDKLVDYLSNITQLEKYIKKTKVKAGLFEKKQVKLNDLIKVMKKRYRNQSDTVIVKLQQFDFEKYYHLINNQSILTEVQKEWLKLIIIHRRNYILKLYEEEVET
ncbi:HipA domain-containing protein [Paenibacillus sp. FSL L8-0493]|uniref:HipA domain-containing protein n=1 Tax=unclassified Paenibacillus TaxID=185978 RepID=UPI0030DD3E56